jgi:cell division protein FtsB
MSLGRSALVALPIAAGFVLLAVFPLRTWLDQQDAIADTRDRLARLQAENDRLDADAARLANPAEIERRARAQFNLVYPGEEAIAIIAPEPTAPSTPATAPTTTTTTPTTTGP